MDAAAALYRDKQRGYFNYPRLDLLAMLPAGGGLRLLELGAGDGATLREAKARGIASYTVGVDIVDAAAPGGGFVGVAAGGALGAMGSAGAVMDGPPQVDRFVVGNVETMDLDLPADHFDAVLCADVLEHLIDPWRVVRLLACHLRPGGLFLSSIPNLRNHRALAQIVLKGDFHYAEAGLLDRSHLRFFCRKNVRELFIQAGLVVEAMEDNMGAYGLRHKAIDFLSAGLLRDFFVLQFRTRARKPWTPAAGCGGP
ncbi:MAG TPA: methyltransferase domain-containing protein [Thermoanaerobaculia bacterium]|nr:methyltransferase domain-containing protein [Thermoanaerobaculia bacterium]